jgi:hypothetical protein
VALSRQRKREKKAYGSQSPTGLSFRATYPYPFTTNNYNNIGPFITTISWSPFMAICRLCTVKVAFFCLVGIMNSFSAETWPVTFATRQGTRFVVNDSTFFFAGTNVYDFFTFGDGWNDASDSAVETGYINKQRIDAHMARLSKDKVRVVRLWMFSHEQWQGFERQKGVYNESQFKLFDYLVESARKNRIFLIPTLENYWEAYGGIDTRLSWEGLPTGQSARWQFFNKQKCPGCFTQYKNYAAHVLEHVNHYNGVAFKNEKTIFAWDLMNEPRYQNATPDENKTGVTLRAWVDTMAGFIKTIDKNHMVCAGLEGHESRYGFGGDEGNPFIYIQKSSFLDFSSAHPYPTEGWANLSIDQTKTLVRSWISDSHDSLGKPFFMGEFNMHRGNSYGTRSQWWQAVFSILEESGAAGSAFWWYQDRPVDGNFGVSEGDAELAVFRDHADRMAAKSGPISVGAADRHAAHMSGAQTKPGRFIVSAHLLAHSNRPLYDIRGKRICGLPGAGVHVLFIK